MTDTKSSGYFGRFGGYLTVKEFKARAKRLFGGLLAFVRHHFKYNRYPCVYMAKMKKEIVTIVKLLMRKQRMFLIMCKEHVVAHKYFFSKQNKRLRGYQEIAHGRSWFHGEVDRLAQELNKHDIVISEDDLFWDKNFMFQQSVYDIQVAALKKNQKLTDEDEILLSVVVENCVKCITVLPTGDIVVLQDVNPSGKDATTETNCIARCLVEAYMQVKYFQHIERPISWERIVRHHKGTNYLGDDRIAGSNDYPPGYFDFYEEHVSDVGVLLKTHVRTKGAEGAEFAGFTIRRSHWDPEYYVPYYRVDKIWMGLFTSPYETFDILMSRFMAFAVLLYPQYTEFTRLRPIVLAFLQSRREESALLPVAIRLWGDEDALRRMWTGQESGGGRRHKEEGWQPFNQEEQKQCLTQCSLIVRSLSKGWTG